MKLDTRSIAVAALLLIGAVGVVAVLIATSQPLQPNTFRFELAKTGLQVVAVAFLGSGAAIAVFSYQERTRQLAESERGKREDARRAEDLIRDQRDRLDELRRETLEITVRGYNKIKSLRRQLRAELVDPQGRLDPVAYQQHLTDLIEQQLHFEELRRLSPMLKDPTLEPSFKQIEKYVGVVTTEYEDMLKHVRQSATDPRQLPQLHEFLEPGPFHANVATGLNRITNRLHQSLLQPFSASAGVSADMSDQVDMRST